MHSLILTRFNLLKKAWHAARDASVSLRLPQDDHARAMEMQLHATIVEMTGACIRLFELGNYSPLPILLRVAYEALADQIALARNPQYLHNIGAASAHEGRALPELLNRHGNDTLKIFLGAPGAREALRRLKENQEHIVEQGGARQDPEQKFAAAGMDDEYPFYRLISGPVHNDGAVLIERHIRRDSDGIEYLELFRTPSDLELASRFNLATGNLLRSCMSLYGEPRFQAYFDKVTEFIRQDDADGEPAMAAPSEQ